MNIKTDKVRPDTLSKGDYIFDPNTKKWEPVKSVYWSESNQIYVVYCGALGLIMHTYGASVKVWRQRYY